MTVDAGSEVIWSNDGTISTAITGTILDGADAGELFGSGTLIPGDTYSFIFEAAGVYLFFSPSQPWMNGTITAEAGDTDGHDTDGMKEHDTDEHDTDGMKEHDTDEHDTDGMKGHEMDDTAVPSDPPAATGMMSDGTMVVIHTTEPIMG